MSPLKKLFNYFRHRRDTVLLLSAFALLVLALFRPTIPVKHNIYTYFFVADISQSMNAIDMTIDGKPASRIAHTQKMLSEIVSSLPCGTKVSLGLFAGVSVAALYTPIEVCANFAAIKDTIDHLDWRTGWSGNSRIRESMYNMSRTLRSFPEPAQVVYFSDGEEAPKLHAFNTRDLSNFQGGDGWLLVGIGSEKGTDIPKLDDKNQLIGYWSAESFAMQPGIAQISQNNLGVRDDKVAGSPGDRFVSKLEEDYMKSVAKEVGGNYVRGDNLQSILAAMKAQKPARHDVAPFDLQWLLASLAGLLLIAAYLPKHPGKQLRALLDARKNRRQKSEAADTADVLF
jgi:mxaL protein